MALCIFVANDGTAVMNYGRGRLLRTPHESQKFNLAQQVPIKDPDECEWHAVVPGPTTAAAVMNMEGDGSTEGTDPRRRHQDWPKGSPFGPFSSLPDEMQRWPP